MPRKSTQEIQFAMRDFSRGIVGGISERGIAKVDWLAAADNYYGRPYRGLRVRPGSRDLSTAILSDQPHSLMGYYSGGGNKLFVGAAAKIFEIGSSAYTLQSLPSPHPASSDIFTHTNLNGVLVAVQRGGALTPLQYDGAWKELKLPVTVATIGFAADGAGGAVDAGTHYYRIRWRFANGSSKAGPVSAAHVVAGPNNTVNINAGLDASARSDYIGWTLERTKINAPSNAGPWWFVADGTALTYADTKADASLGYRVDEGLHGEPPHLDGITSFADRLVGWSGSYLYLSQATTGSPEGTGIANFDARNLIPVSKDDGDTIQVAISVGKQQLLVLKRRSQHVFAGTDLDSFILESIVYSDPSRGSEAGCAGPRAACAIGGAAFFWGESGGLFIYSGGKIKPVAWMEMGRYLDEVNPAELDKLCLINHQGNYLLAFYPKATSPIPKDQLVFDARLPRWWHWKDWAARDAIELKTTVLGSSFAFCDPTNYGAFQAISNGASITGSGVSGGTTVSGAVPAGATSLTMSANATATAQNVTLTIAGVATPHCNTTSGSPTVTISEYHVWSGFEGFKDRKAQNGTGGVAPSTMLETPWLDGGMPDEWKDLDRLSFASEVGDQTGVSISIQTDPSGGASALTLTTTGTGADWAPDIGSGPNDLEWDVGDWASDLPNTIAGGVQTGTIGRRFKIIATANPVGDHRPSGIEMVATLLPDKEYDK